MQETITVSALDLLKLKRVTKGWKSMLSGVDYSRTTEWPLAANLLDLQPGQKVLDVGSGDNSLFPLLLAFKFPVEILAVDYSDPMPLLRKFAKKGTEEGWLRGTLNFDTADLRALPFPDGTFDRAACVSTIEHVPGDGDAKGMAELARVLRPGGKIVVTTPFVAEYREEYKRDNVYERTEKGQDVFFQKLYDFKSLNERLIQPSGLTCTEKRFLLEPGYRYFWKQDCERREIDGRTVLTNRGLTYLQRCMALPFSKLYTRSVDEAQARLSPESLFACAFVLFKE